MLTIRNLEKIYRTEEVETVALNKVAMHIKESEFVAVMGPSGCGKSTLLNIVGLLDSPDGGELYLNGEEVGHLNERNRAETKTKELRIRKVLGATIGNIVNMLSKEFLILVGIAMVIAFPLAYYLLNKMLQDYAYRVTITWWMFALAAIITIALTMLTVGWKAVQAATANPAESIKTE